MIYFCVRILRFEPSLPLLVILYIPQVTMLRLRYSKRHTEYLFSKYAIFLLRNTYSMICNDLSGTNNIFINIRMMKDVIHNFYLFFTDAMH